MKKASENELVLHEEEMDLATAVREVGVIRARKRIANEEVDEVFPRTVERADVERIAPNERDSGEIETLPDGSISIPVLEEELVVTKRVVVRERIVIRKETNVEQHEVRAELRRERLEINATETSSHEGGT
jgi:uncharacterized protein (TIGR02271 family)